MNFFKKTTLILACAIIYYVTFYLNKYLFDTLEFSYGVNWIFIPSGIQLLLVLIAVSEGAVGIALASFIIGLESYLLDTVARTFVTALIAGFSPLLSRKICFDFLKIESELSNISLHTILKLSFVFALISASLHQVWFFFNSKSDLILQSLFVMAFGNLVGTFLVLAVVQVVTSRIQNDNFEQK